MSNQRWADEHSAKGAPLGIVLYDHDDDLFTVKTKDGEWAVYYRTVCDLNNRDIDGDRGDEIVGILDEFADTSGYVPPGVNH